MDQRCGHDGRDVRQTGDRTRGRPVRGVAVTQGTRVRCSPRPPTTRCRRCARRTAGVLACGDRGDVVDALPRGPASQPCDGLVVPKSPKLFAPQAQTVPSAFSAYRVPALPATAMTWLRPLTCTGSSLFGAREPLPSSPCRLSPQSQTVPSARMHDAAHVVLYQGGRVGDAGDRRWGVARLVGRRGWVPQLDTVPSECRATPLPATPATPARSRTWTGVTASRVLPSPSWPEPLAPHAQTVWSPTTAYAESPFAATVRASALQADLDGDGRAVGAAVAQLAPSAAAPRVHDAERVEGVARSRLPRPPRRCR